jgi:CheY-like chemotaxis protein
MKTHPTKSILLIEDDPIDIDLIIRAFKKSTSHHHIEVVHNGNDVLALISSWELGGYSPALILLDMKLPQMNGIEILRILKSHP